MVIVGGDPTQAERANEAQRKAEETQHQQIEQQLAANRQIQEREQLQARSVASQRSRLSLEEAKAAVRRSPSLRGPEAEAAEAGGAATGNRPARRPMTIVENENAQGQRSAAGLRGVPGRAGQAAPTRRQEEKTARLSTAEQRHSALAAEEGALGRAGPAEGGGEGKEEGEAEGETEPTNDFNAVPPERMRFTKARLGRGSSQRIRLAPAEALSRGGSAEKQSPAATGGPGKGIATLLFGPHGGGLGAFGSSTPRAVSLRNRLKAPGGPPVAHGPLGPRPPGGVPRGPGATPLAPTRGPVFSGPGGSGGGGTGSGSGQRPGGGRRGPPIRHGFGGPPRGIPNSSGPLGTAHTIRYPGTPGPEGGVQGLVGSPVTATSPAPFGPWTASVEQEIKSLEKQIAVLEAQEKFRPGEAQIAAQIASDEAQIAALELLLTPEVSQSSLTKYQKSVDAEIQSMVAKGELTQSQASQLEAELNQILKSILTTGQLGALESQVSGLLAAIGASGSLPPLSTLEQELRVAARRGDTSWVEQLQAEIALETETGRASLGSIEQFLNNTNAQLQTLVNEGVITEAQAQNYITSLVNTIDSYGQVSQGLLSVISNSVYTDLFSAQQSYEVASAFRAQENSLGSLKDAILAQVQAMQPSVQYLEIAPLMAAAGISPQGAGFQGDRSVGAWELYQETQGLNAPPVDFASLKQELISFLDFQANWHNYEAVAGMLAQSQSQSQGAAQAGIYPAFPTEYSRVGLRMDAASVGFPGFGSLVSWAGVLGTDVTKAFVSLFAGVRFPSTAQSLIADIGLAKVGAPLADVGYGLKAGFSWLFTESGALGLETARLAHLQAPIPWGLAVSEFSSETFQLPSWLGGGIYTGKALAGLVGSEAAYWTPLVGALSHLAANPGESELAKLEDFSAAVLTAIPFIDAGLGVRAGFPLTRAALFGAGFNVALGEGYSLLVGSNRRSVTMDFGSLASATAYLSSLPAKYHATLGYDSATGMYSVSYSYLAKGWLTPSEVEQAAVLGGILGVGGFLGGIAVAEGFGALGIPANWASRALGGALVNVALGVPFTRNPELLLGYAGLGALMGGLLPELGARLGSIPQLDVVQFSPQEDFEGWSLVFRVGRRFIPLLSHVTELVGTTDQTGEDAFKVSFTRVSRTSLGLPDVSPEQFGALDAIGPGMAESSEPWASKLDVLAYEHALEQAGSDVEYGYFRSLREIAFGMAGVQSPPPDEFALELRGKPVESEVLTGALSEGPDLAYATPDQAPSLARLKYWYYRMLQNPEAAADALRVPSPLRMVYGSSTFHMFYPDFRLGADVDVQFSPGTRTVADIWAAQIERGLNEAMGVEAYGIEEGGDVVGTGLAEEIRAGEHLIDAHIDEEPEVKGIDLSKPATGYRFGIKPMKVVEVGEEGVPLREPSETIVSKVASASALRSMTPEQIQAEIQDLLAQGRINSENQTYVEYLSSQAKEPGSILRWAAPALHRLKDVRDVISGARIISSERMGGRLDEAVSNLEVYASLKGLVTPPEAEAEAEAEAAAAEGPAQAAASEERLAASPAAPNAPGEGAAEQPSPSPEEAAAQVRDALREMGLGSVAASEQEAEADAWKELASSLSASQAAAEAEYSIASPYMSAEASSPDRSSPLIRRYRAPSYGLPSSGESSPASGAASPSPSPLSSPSASPSPQLPSAPPPSPGSSSPPTSSPTVTAPPSPSVPPSSNPPPPSPSPGYPPASAVSAFGGFSSGTLWDFLREQPTETVPLLPLLGPPGPLTGKKRGWSSPLYRVVPHPLSANPIRTAGDRTGGIVVGYFSRGKGRKRKVHPIMRRAK